MKSILFGLVAVLAAMPATAEMTVRVNDPDQIYQTKITDQNVAPIYFGEIGYIDQKQVPWRSVSAGKWSREVDPSMKKDSYSLEAKADYDLDGKQDTAKIYTNGQQTAVIVTFDEPNKAPVVAFKVDGVDPGMEITGKGNRFMVSIPDVGYTLLAMHKSKPVAVATSN